MYVIAFMIGFGAPIAFLIYTLWTYIRWKSKAETGAKFATDYWYTNKNPLHRTWWPVLAIIGFLVALTAYGLLLGE